MLFAELKLAKRRHDAAVSIGRYYRGHKVCVGDMSRV